jgi:hypothetical protein
MAGKLILLVTSLFLRGCIPDCILMTTDVDAYRQALAGEIAFTLPFNW